MPDLAARAIEYVSNLGKEDMAGRFLNSTILSSQNRPKFSVRLRDFMGGFGHKHHWMYDNTSMIYMLKEAGFEICENNDSPSKTWRSEDNDNQVNVLARKA